MSKGWRKLLFISVVIAMVVSPLVGCAAEQVEEGKAFKIGIICPLTGGAAAIGDNTKMGATLAAEEINAAGGILGCQIELVFADSEMKPEVGVAAAQRLITHDGVKVLYGMYDEVTALAEYDVACKYDIPVITDGCTAGFMGELIKEDPEKYRLLWKPCPPGENHGRAFVGLLETIVLDKLYQPESKNICITTDDTEWAIEHIAAVQKYLEQSPLWDEGWRITYTETYAWGETDFLAIMSKLKAADPGFVLDVDCHIPGGAAYVKQFRDAGIKCPLSQVYLPCASEFSDITGEAANGLVYPGVIMITPTEKGKAFVKRIYDRFGVDVGLEANVGLAHDALYMIKEAYERAGTLDDIDKFIEEMNKTKYSGNVGVIAWNPETHEGISGEDYIPTQVFQFQDMERVVIWPAKYAQAEYQTPDWLE